MLVSQIGVSILMPSNHCKWIQTFSIPWVQNPFIRKVVDLMVLKLNILKWAEETRAPIPESINQCWPCHLDLQIASKDQTLKDRSIKDWMITWMHGLHLTEIIKDVLIGQELRCRQHPVEQSLKTQKKSKLKSNKILKKKMMLHTSLNITPIVYARRNTHRP